MGVTIQFESHKVELWAIYQMEHDQEVLEYYDQPPAFPIKYQNKSGRKIGHYHTPDFFVIRKKEAAWEEWKTEEELQRLSEKYPTRYQKTEDGNWISPPGNAYAEPLGLKYYVRSNAELEAIFIQNLIFLEDYLKFTPSIPPKIQAQIEEKVKTLPSISLASLMATSAKVRANDVYIMIAQGLIYVDLTAVSLKEHSWVQLYPDKSTHDAYVNYEQSKKTSLIRATSQLVVNTPLVWDGRLWRLVNLGETTTTLLPEMGEPMQIPSGFFHQLLEKGCISISKTEQEGRATLDVQRILSEASPGNLEEANRRFHSVMAYLQGSEQGYLDINERTLRRWLKNFRTAEANYGCGYIGLVPLTQKRGNRKPKAPSDSRELLDKFIAEHFETPKQAKAASVYRAYQRECENQKITPLSRSTFYQRLKKRRSPKHIKKREGAKVAYKNQPWHWELTYSTPRHGDHPLEIVHLDHTQLDLELRCTTTGRLLGRPWLTLLIDAYSRRILAVYLTFDAPSYRACMMALRICVQREGRFPQALVVDGGKEFHSIYFDTLLARHHCLKKTRPGSKPRFGSVIERLFGTTNTQFIYNLLGNTQASKNPRSMTKVINPQSQAVWTLGDLYTYLAEWAYQIYEKSEHPALGTTPGQCYSSGLIQTGEREHRHISYNEEFILQTLPSTRTGVAKIQTGRGIKLNYLYYWSDAFRNPEIEGTKIPVRYDPFDIGVAYAYCQGRWLKCISQYYSTFSGHSEKELLLATQELKRLAKLTHTSSSISAKRLADFISQVQEHETLLLQRLRDLEAHQVLNALTEEKAVPPEMFMSGMSNSSKAVKQPYQKEEELSPVELELVPIFEEYH
jgi:putative transposase